MRGHGTALAHLLFLAARRRPHEFGLHGCLLRSHPLTLPTAPISFNFLAVNDIGRGTARADGPVGRTRRETAGTPAGSGAARPAAGGPPTAAVCPSTSRAPGRELP